MIPYKPSSRLGCPFQNPIRIVYIHTPVLRLCVSYHIQLKTISTIHTQQKKVIPYLAQSDLQVFSRVLYRYAIPIRRNLYQTIRTVLARIVGFALNKTMQDCSLFQRKQKNSPSPTNHHKPSAIIIVARKGENPIT